MTETKKVIFFDGYCGLCNGFVDFILKIDKEELFSFSPLQSDFAKSTLPAEFTRDLKSIVVSMNGINLKGASAVLAVLKQLKSPWKTVSYLSILPLPILNFVYELVAENRYRLFGKRSTCRLPTPEEQKRFIL